MQNPLLPKRRKRVYPAGPMSLGDKVSNFEHALRTYRQLVEAGFAPFCPQFSFLVDGLFGFDHATWLSLDLPWVEVADVVLRLPGHSKGADMEVERALACDIPVYHDILDLLAHECPTTDSRTCSSPSCF